VALFDWIIVGGMTGHTKFTPPEKWIDQIVDWCKYMNKPLFIKNNCGYHNKIKQYPEVGK